MGTGIRQNLARYATGFTAAGLIVVLMLEHRDSTPLLFASVFFILICITDTLYAKIPNLLNLALLLGGIAFNLHAAGAAGLLDSLLGALLGFGLLIAFYLMGGMGAGDVKALAALGALLGPAGIFQVFLYMGLVGGLMAILHYALAHNLRQKCREGWSALKVYLYTREWQFLKPENSGEQMKFPYAAAITFGYFAFVRWGAIV